MQLDLEEPNADLEVSPGDDAFHAVSAFYNREADLLDNYEFAQWGEYLHEDIVYRMPTRTTRFLRDGLGFSSMSFLEENHDSLVTRIKRLETEFAWAEAPPSRTRHFVSNLRVFGTEDVGELYAKCNFMVTRTRSDLDYQLFTGSRHDRLVQEEDGLKIRRRTILVDQTAITATNLSVLF